MLSLLPIPLPNLWQEVISEEAVCIIIWFPVLFGAGEARVNPYIVYLKTVLKK
jgi:hypothetical protein